MKTRTATTSIRSSWTAIPLCSSISRALAETSGDVASIQGLLETLTREAQNLLTQQARIITELQNSLMRTRMVPFQRHVQRLTRLVRQAANDTGKRAELVVQGAAAELDRQMLERMVAPLEHMLRNAVVHGIELPERRAALGKPEVGRISVSLTRDGAEVVIVVSRRRQRHQREVDPRESRGARSHRPPVETHRRGGHAAHSGAGLQHRRARHAGGGPRRRHGRGRDRGQEARRRLVHRIDRRQGLALHDSSAVHACHQPGADRARRGGGVCVAAGDRGRRRAPAAQHRGAAPRQGRAAVRVRRPEIPLPAAGLLRRSRRHALARNGRVDVGRADPSGRAFHRAGDG